MLSVWRLALQSLFYHRRLNLALALGVAAATAVLTGALVVGDSMRGSLRRLTLERLGRIDLALVAPEFFRTKLAEELGSDLKFLHRFEPPVPLILLEGTLAEPESKRRASRVTIVGADKGFWALGDGPRAVPQAGEVVLNQPLADELRVKPGQDVMLSLPRVLDIPADSALGRKEDTVRSRRLKVASVIKADGLGRFNLRPNQRLPLVAFVPQETLQAMLSQPDKVNALLVASRGGKSSAIPSVEDERLAQNALRPQLADYGLSLTESPQGYVQLTSQRMLLEPASEKAATEPKIAPRIQPTFTYLANTIADGDKEIPYSTVMAIDFDSRPPLGPFHDAEGKPVAPLADDQIALNSWAAEQLQAQPGDTIRLTYFEPEAIHGKTVERSTELKLAGIVELSGAADDPMLTPELKGVTDKKSMADWDPPFPFSASRIRKVDDEYWQQHRAAPKAYVSLATGRKLWGSRFGQTTAVRYAADGSGNSEGAATEKLAADVATRLHLEPQALGFTFQPVKRQGLEAASGTTPFDALFLGFSAFIIIAALMLVSLLFRLSMDSRAAQIGVLLALGLRPKSVSRLLLIEAMLVAVCGALVGMILGVAYAALMLSGLKTWWLEAISTPFLTLYVTPDSLMVGYLIGALTAWGTIAWACRRLRHVAARDLLGRKAGLSVSDTGKPPRWPRWAFWICGLGAIGLALAAFSVPQSGQAPMFFGSGFLALVACLAQARSKMTTASQGTLISTGAAPYLRLAARNSARNPARSTLTLGLVAAASFLIVALSAFRLDPTAGAGQLTDGTGGLALVAQSDQPIYQDISSHDGREALSFPASLDRRMQKAAVFACRVQAGEDASCLNLYQPRQPRILGVPAPLIERGGFAWSAIAKDATAAEQANPWKLLERRMTPDTDGKPRAPVVLDQNTATYSLHLAQGVGDHLDVTDTSGQTLRLVVVGLLNNSILQGDLIISERDLLKHFPDVGGYQFFLVQAPESETAAVSQGLESVLGDFGFDAQPAVQRLARFQAVQNTYLSTFQSLGGLGLLLGTFGLATVQLRNVLERRRELALLRAAGFRRGLLARLVMWENALLLAGGLAIGVLASLIAVAPHLLSGNATIPWSWLATTLGIVLAVGLLAGLTAVRSAVATPVLEALRAE